MCFISNRGLFKVQRSGELNWSTIFYSFHDLGSHNTQIRIFIKKPKYKYPKKGVIVYLIFQHAYPASKLNNGLRVSLFLYNTFFYFPEIFRIRVALLLPNRYNYLIYKHTCILHQKIILIF